jgi:hypothetical protein
MQTPSTWRIYITMAKGSQSTFLEPPLMTAHRPHRTTEGTGYIILIGPALFDQANHNVGLSHRVAYRVVGQHKA